MYVASLGAYAMRLKVLCADGTKYRRNGLHEVLYEL